MPYWLLILFLKNHKEPLRLDKAKQQRAEKEAKYNFIFKFILKSEFKKN